MCSKNLVRLPPRKNALLSMNVANVGWSMMTATDADTILVSHEGRP
jgi:hypothetical protein